MLLKKMFRMSKKSIAVTNTLKRLKGFVKRFLPGGLRHTAEIYGVGETFLWILRTAWSYKRTILNLSKKRGIRVIFNYQPAHS